MTENYYVYLHTSPQGKKYVGITRREPKKRWRKGEGYKENPHFYAAIKKYGWENFKHEILHEGLLKTTAEKIEMELIKRYRSNKSEYGYNRDNGGRCLGTHTKEWKEMMRLRNSGEGNPFYGKRHSEETIKKISGKNNHRYGTCWTAEKHELMKKALKGKPKRRETIMRMKKAAQNRTTSVSQYTQKKEHIKTYKSIAEAEEKTGINKSNICYCCKGLRQKAGGFMWEYAGRGVN